MLIVICNLFCLQSFRTLPIFVSYVSFRFLRLLRNPLASAVVATLLVTKHMFKRYVDPDTVNKKRLKFYNIFCKLCFVTLFNENEQD